MSRSVLELSCYNMAVLQPVLPVMMVLMFYRLFTGR